jgi:Trypsin-co-occurring domain 1
MPYFVEIPLGDGQVVLAKLADQAEDVVPFGRGQEAVGRLAGSLSEGLGRARSFAAEVLQAMKDSAEPPERVAIEFGLDFSGKAGVVIAETSAGAHVTVTLEWSRSAHAEATPPAGT